MTLMCKYLDSFFFHTDFRHREREKHLHLSVVAMMQNRQAMKHTFCHCVHADRRACLPNDFRRNGCRTHSD